MVIKKELRTYTILRPAFGGKREHTLAQTDCGSVHCSGNGIGMHTCITESQKGHSGATLGWLPVLKDTYVRKTIST